MDRSFMDSVHAFRAKLAVLFDDEMVEDAAAWMEGVKVEMTRQKCRKWWKAMVKSHRLFLFG